MSDEETRDQDEDEVEAHKNLHPRGLTHASDEGDEGDDVEAHKNLHPRGLTHASDEGDEGDDVEAHKLNPA